MINLEEWVLFCEGLWWFIVFAEMLTFPSLFMPHRLPFLACSCHTAFEPKIKKSLLSPQYSASKNLSMSLIMHVFFKTCRRSALSLCLSVHAQVVRLYWSPALDENQTGIFWRCYNFTASHYLSLVGDKSRFPRTVVVSVCFHRII